MEKVVISTLRKIGMKVPQDPSPRVLRTCIEDFQRAWAFYNLLIDGRVGEKTALALERCVDRDGRISPHFRLAEFESKGTDDFTIRVHRELVRGLEEYRDAFGPVVIISGHRTETHNDNVGGAELSQHVPGNAADVPPKATVAQVKALRRFSGIGFQGATGLVRHVDVRHVGPNTTGGSVTNPTVWKYA